jgi:nucleoside-diphosphate-sugar epimerase
LVVLVTGGAGFIGSVVTRHLLARGHHVRVLDNLMYGGESLLGVWDHDDVEILVGDLTVPAIRERALAGAPGVVHLAGIVGDPACKRTPEEAWRINYEGTRALVEDAVRAGVRRFVFASTCSNYGVSDPDEIVDEDSALNPISLYAESKVKAEGIVLEASGGSFDPMVLRLATVYGVSPRMRFDLLVNDFTREAVLRRKIVVYGEQFWRPYVHVVDVARAVELSLTAPSGNDHPRVFNVGDTSQNFQKLEIAHMARVAVPGTEIEIVPQGQDPRSYRVSFERARTVLGYSITRVAPDGVEQVRRLLADGVITDSDAPKYAN